MNGRHQRAYEAMRAFDPVMRPLVRFYLAAGPFKRLRGALLNAVCWLLGRYLLLRGLV